LEILHPHISNINREDIGPRALSALVRSYLKQKAIEKHEVKMMLDLKAAKAIIASYQTFPGALFVKLPYRPTESNVGSLMERQVRVALQEVMLNAYNRLKREHSLLGLESSTVDDINRTCLQVRDMLSTTSLSGVIKIQLSVLLPQIFTNSLKRCLRDWKVVII